MSTPLVRTYSKRGKDASFYAATPVSKVLESSQDDAFAFDSGCNKRHETPSGSLEDEPEVAYYACPKLKPYTATSAF